MAMINPRSDRRQSKKVKLKSNKSTAELRATWSKSQRQKRELEGKDHQENRLQNKENLKMKLEQNASPRCIPEKGFSS